MHLTLAFNPSHLEIVNPVVEGSVRARQHRRDDNDGDQVLPVLIHGDAAFAGQGVVMETLNLAQTRGYGTGGTVHIVVNNQIGFTTSDPRDARSTLYCTDVAKMVEAPIFHVNGDDPEAVRARRPQLALDYRSKFHKDVVIDLVCFRKLGHNEQDEPMVTQPLMYKKIAQHPGTRKLYADKLVAQGVISADDADDDDQRRTARRWTRGKHTNRPVLSNFKPQVRGRLGAVPGRRSGPTPPTPRVPLAEAEGAGASSSPTFPPSFKLHPRVEKVIADRRADGGRASCRSTGAWARTSPTPSLLEDGYAVRLSGQDAGRGTFAHRHAVLHDQNRETLGRGHLHPAAAHRRGPGAISSSSTRCCPRRRCSASSTATRPPSRTSWSSGKRSSATSPTARRW